MSDSRFPSPGTDARFPSPGTDARFYAPGGDARFDGTGYGLGAFTLTIASGKVSSDLTDFPLYVDLSDMPAGFWAAVDDGGGNIRAYASDGTTELALDVVFCAKTAETGAAFVRVPTIAAASTTTVIIKTLTEGTAKAAPGSAYGRNAVWADYEAVYTFGDSNEDRTGNTVSIYADGDAINYTRTTLHTFTQDAHQGLTFDHVNRKWYVFDTNAIYKFNEDFSTLDATNADPAGDANTDSGETALDHICDGCVANGYLVVPINDYKGSGGAPTIAYIARFDLGTLALVDTFDISATRPEISGICWDGSRYVSVHWDSMTVLDVWDTSFVRISTITLTNVTPFLQAQGIEYWHGAYWVTSDSADETYRVEVSGYVQDTGLVGDTVTGNYEGISAYDDSLVVLIDPSAANSYARKYTRFTSTLYAGGGSEHQGSTAQYKEGPVSSLGTTWTMSCSFEIDTVTQMALMTYRDFSSGAVNDRVTLAIDDGNKVAVWDDANSWLYASPSINPGTGVPHRISVTYDGTSRYLFSDGALVNTENSITARDAGFDYLTIGTDDETRGDPLDGKIGFVYLTGAALSEAWIAAEYANLNAPGSFYSVS